MSIKINHELPIPEVLKNEYPLSNEQKSIKQQRDEEIRRIFTGESDKFVVLVGPCSADNEDTVCEYVNRLKKVSDKVSDKLMIIPRVYTNKPRTTGDGYKGMLHQPDPDKAPVPGNHCARQTPGNGHTCRSHFFCNILPFAQRNRPNLRGQFGCQMSPSATVAAFRILPVSSFFD